MSTRQKLMPALLLLLSLLLSFELQAHENHHVKHNMVLFGETEIFASHIVYKVPHNFQVILKLALDESVKSRYLLEKKTYPDDQMIFLLDHMQISDIGKMDQISGQILREDQNGDRVVLMDKVTVSREHFKIIFFDELPLVLGQ